MPSGRKGRARLPIVRTPKAIWPSATGRIWRANWPTASPHCSWGIPKTASSNAMVELDVGKKAVVTVLVVLAMIVTSCTPEPTGPASEQADDPAGGQMNHLALGVHLANAAHLDSAAVHFGAAARLQARLVREALAIAIDREAVNSHVLGGLGRPVEVTYFSTAHPLWQEQWNYGYDPAEAQRILTEDIEADYQQGGADTSEANLGGNAFGWTSAVDADTAPDAQADAEEKLKYPEDAVVHDALFFWARGLAGMSRAAVLGALERHARVSAWPAELSELRALCLGVPTLGEVRVMLRDESARKPPFVVLMFQQLDYYNWKMADQRTADRWLADAYATAREHVMLGGALPEVKG